MLNVIRTFPGRVLYCGKTVDNLIRSNDGETHEILIRSSNKTPNENGLDCIRAGIKHGGGEPFVFLEDDLAFIRNFNRAAKAFYDACAGSGSRFLPLCANYTKALDACRGIAWNYPLKDFYGSQAFVIAPDMAESFLFWANNRQIPPRGFDLLIKDWAVDAGYSSVLTPQRSFVQHIGVESSLHNGRFHHYASWPGPDYQWRTGAFSLDEQAKRPCDEPLAHAIAQWFGPKLPAYDLGCSTGKYVTILRQHKINASGFDATPGIAAARHAQAPIAELDLARPQVFHETPGNVMCLEVAEHIHLDQTEAFTANIKALCADKLVLSWALPGQGGRRHVNEQPSEWVISLMRAKGFTVDAAKSHELSEAATIKWFKRSIYAFQRRA